MKKLKIPVLIIGALLFAFAVIDSLDLFVEKEYHKITHGDHIHYLPVKRNPDLPLDAFPTKLPPEGYVIGPDGHVVHKDSVSTHKH